MTAGACSVFQRVEFVHLHGLATAVKGDDDGEADRDLGGGNGKDEENKDVAVENAVEARKGDESEGCGHKHQLEAHVDDEGVLAQQDAEEADGEKQRAQADVFVQADHFTSSRLSNFLQSTMTPSMAMSRRKPMISTGSR